MKRDIFRFLHSSPDRGSMLVELLMTVALAAVVIPFVFQYQYNAARRAENASIVRQMDAVQSALERYIVDRGDDMLATVGRSISRVDIADLVEYGLSSDIAAGAADKYQLRVLKSDDVGGRATLQGVVVMAAGDISPMRTREIVNMGGDNMGFVDGTHAYGTFGAWRADASDIGIDATDAIVNMTPVQRDHALYLYRMPSDDAADATMMGMLNLGGHDIKNAQSANANLINATETLRSAAAAVGSLIFQNRTTIDSVFVAQNATVSGVLSSDARNMEIDGRLTLADVGKFTSLTMSDLWVSDMTLAGISISSSTDPAILKINQKLDMTAGRVDAMFLTVGFSGSITPRLNIRKRLDDPVSPGYFWDASTRTAHFNDMSFRELNIMANAISRMEAGASTEAGRLFSVTAANSNATVSDFLNTITEISARVRAKYSLLNLK